MARRFYLAPSVRISRLLSLMDRFSSDHLLYAPGRKWCLINLIGTAEGVYPRGVTNYTLYTSKHLQRTIICRPIIMFIIL